MESVDLPTTVVGEYYTTPTITTKKAESEGSEFALMPHAIHNIFLIGLELE
jgi:hypothetical protein